MKIKERKREIEKKKLDDLNGLKKKLEALPKWPYFSSVKNSLEFEEVNLQLMKLMIISIMDSKLQLEKDIKKKIKETDPKKIDYERINQDRSQIQEKINHEIGKFLKYFYNPNQLISFSSEFVERGETDLVIQVAEKCYQLLDPLEAKLEKYLPVENETRELKKQLNSLTSLRKLTEKQEED